MKINPVILAFIFCSCAVVGLYMPHAAAADSAGGGDPYAIITTANLNVTNVSLENATIPAQYKLTPSPLEVGISTNKSSDGSLKGEMAAVPRTIGFSITPEMVVILIVLAAALGIGAWYFLKQKQEKEKQE